MECQKCVGKGWIPCIRKKYNKNDDYLGYYHDHYECGKCDATGYTDHKNMGQKGHPGCSGLIPDLSPK